MKKYLLFIIFILLSINFIHAEILINITGQSDEWVYNTENTITATASCITNNCTNIVLWPRYNKSSLSPDTDVFMDLLWAFNTTGTFDVFGSPTYHNGIMYTGSKKYNDSYDGWNKLFAYNVSSGEQLWNKTYGQIDVAPYYKDGYLYISTYDDYNHFYKIDSTTGEQYCNYTINSGGSVSDIIIDELGISYFCGAGDTYCYAINNTDCSEVWKVSIGFFDITATSLSLYEDNLYLTRYAGFGNGFYSLNKNDGSTNWSITKFYGTYWDSSPLILPNEGIVYTTPTYLGFYGGNATAYNLSTGEVVWTKLLNLSVVTSSYYNGVIYGATSQESSIYALNATTGETLWFIPDSELGNSNYSIYSSPVISELGFMIQPLTELDQTLIIDTSDGTILRRINDAMSYSSPLISDGYYINNYDDWYTRIYELSWGERTNTNWDLFKNSQYRNGTNIGALKRYLGPISCGDLEVGQSCSVSWTFNASKDIYTDWMFDIASESSYNDGTDHNITSYSNEFSINITDYYDDHLLLYMSFDDDTSSKAYDLSKHDNDGTISGATITGDGYINDAFKLDGINDRISITKSPELNLTSNFTLCVWEKADGFTGSFEYILSDYGTGSTRNWNLQRNNELIGFRTCDVDSGCSTLSGGSLSRNVWHQICCSLGLNNRSVYIDGSYIDSDTQDTVLTGYSNDIKIGSNNDPGVYYNGTLDEIMIFNSVLTPEQISDIYNNQSQRFREEGIQTVQFQNITPGYNTVNITMDDFRLNGGQIQTRLNYWNVSNGYDDTDSGLVAAWHLDGNANDALGFNNGTVTGATNGTGIFDSGMYFDGINDKITISSFNDSYSNETNTISVWFKTDNSIYQRIVSTRSSPLSSSINGFDLFLRDNGYIHLQVGSNGQNIDAIGNVNLEDGLWHNVIGVIEIGEKLKIYIDGSEISYGTQETLTYEINKTYADLNIGFIPTAYFNGTLDEVRIYNRTLTDEEVKDLYVSGSLIYNNTPWQSLKVNTNTYDYASLNGAVSCYIDSEIDSCGSNDGSLFSTASWDLSNIEIRKEILTTNGILDRFDLNNSIPVLSRYNKSSVLMWFKTKNLSQNEKTIYAEGKIKSNGNSLFKFEQRTDDLRIYARNTDGTTAYDMTATSNKLKENTWHFLSFIQNESSIVVYLDGEYYFGDLTSSKTSLNSNIITVGAEYSFGFRNYINSEFDEVVLINKTLTASEIYDIYIGSKDRHANNNFIVPNSTTIIQPEYKLIAKPNRFLSPTLRASEGLEYSLASYTTTPSNPWFDIIFPIYYDVPFLIMSLGFETNVTGVNTTTIVAANMSGVINTSAEYQVAYNVLSQYDKYSYFYEIVKYQFGAQDLPDIYERNYSLMIQPTSGYVGNLLRIPVNLSEAMEAYSYEWTKVEEPNLNSLLLTTGTIYGGTLDTNVPFVVDTYTG